MKRPQKMWYNGDKMYEHTYTRKMFESGLNRILKGKEFISIDSRDDFFGSIVQMTILYAYILEHNNEDECEDPGDYIEWDDVDGITEPEKFVDVVRTVMAYLDSHNDFFKPSGWEHRLGWTTPRLNRVVQGVDTLTGLKV